MFSMAGFFLEGGCAHLDFIFILFCHAELQISFLAPCLPLSPSLQSLFLVIFFLQKHYFSNWPYKSRQCSYLQGFFSRIFTLTVNLLLLRIVYRRPFVLSCAAFFFFFFPQNVCLFSGKGL